MKGKGRNRGEGGLTGERHEKVVHMMGLEER